MKLSEIFSNNKDIIINTDIDGFLSSMILQKYYGCKVVGFSNSRETIWVTPEVKSIYDPIYIDLYVNSPNVICIDQHIIAFNKSHHEKIRAMGTKINPNLDRERTFVGDMKSDYYHKYPFGTVHYLVSLMAKEGINVNLGDLGTQYVFNISGKRYTTCVGQVMLRADDALYSTLSPYRENALDWWNWLASEKESPAIQSMVNYINGLEIAKAGEYKKNVGEFFKALGCDDIDGAFKTISDNNGNLLPKVSEYLNTITTLIGINVDIPSKYIIHRGKYEIKFCRPGYDMKILDADNLYSYAFIFGPQSKYPNFSYTIDLE